MGKYTQDYMMHICIEYAEQYATTTTVVLFWT